MPLLLVLIGDASCVSGTKCVAVQAYRGFWMELAGRAQNAKNGNLLGGETCEQGYTRGIWGDKTYCHFASDASTIVGQSIDP